MLPPVIRKYLLASISGAPDIVERLLCEIPSDDACWDFQPDSERFTLREVIAHLADWEPIHLERIQRILNENHPDLPDKDESALAIENDYAHAEPAASLTWFRDGRTKLSEVMTSLAEEQWLRTANRIKVGEVSIEGFATLIVAHDSYHFQQIARWLTLYEAAYSE